MKKLLRRVFAPLLGAALMLSSLSLPAMAAESTESYHAFIAIGADGENAGSWGLQYYGENAGSNAGEVTAVEAELKNGETTTISVSFTDKVSYTWFVAPCMIAENPDSIVAESTFDVKVFLDGTEIETNLSAGKNCWVEDTGDYAGNCVRIAGGYNEWADKYIAEAPTGFNTITFEITPHIVVSEVGAAKLSEAEFPAFLALGADGESAGSWGLQYYGADAAGVTATNGVLKNGETTSLVLAFDDTVTYTWFVAPCMIVDDPSTISPESVFDVKVLLDGVEIETDLSAGKSCWAEDTGDYAGNCVRIGGGYNEWGDKYIAEAPAGFKTIEFQITPQIYEVAPVEEEAYVSAAGPVDVNGEYHAYIGFQTPKYSFRNSFDDATYGRDSEVFNQVTGWDADNNAVKMGGEFTDVVIAGNGTYTVSVDGLSFADDEFSSQDYMNLIFLSTDIPNTNEVTISDVELKIDGKSVELAGVGAIVSPDSKDYVNILLQNIWNDDVKTIGFYSVPMSKMSITFTVSGFAYDKAAEEVVTETTPEPVVTETAPVAEPEKSSNTGLIVGIVVVVLAACGCACAVILKKKKKSE